MLTIERRADGVLHIVADGQLTTTDYADFAPQFERLAGASTPMLIELGPSFTGWTFDALLRDLRFDFSHHEHFGRIAVLGDKKWEEWGTDLSSFVFPGEMRFFETSQRGEVEQWLRDAATRESAK